MSNTKKVIIGSIGTLAIITLIVVSLWSFAVYVPQNSQSPKAVLVEIKPGSSISTIAQTLQSQDLITSALIFTLYARMSSKGDRLIPGTYSLKGSMNMPQIVDYLASGKVAARKITIPEGYTVNQIAQLWRGSGFGSAEEFIAAAKQTYSYSFLPAPTPDMKYPVEGYLFPLTYNVNVNATATDFINQMLSAFQAQALPTVTAGLANQTQLTTVQQVVTLASIVEHEASDVDNRAKVAGVFLNRMARGMALESDVTVVYATGHTDLTITDLLSSSPYNTRLKKGLPPGPICNPGLEAMQAVLNPTKSDYIFFLAGRDSQVYYAKTLLEHNQNIARYLK